MTSESSGVGFESAPLLSFSLAQGGDKVFFRFLLLSAKLQNATISLSAMPINRRCGLLFGKVSPPFPTIIHWLSAKTREWKTRDVAKCVL